MITPAYAITATERVLPRMALDFTTGTLDPRVTLTRALNTATRVNSSGYIEAVTANAPRFDYNPVNLAPRGLLIEESRANLVLQSQNLASTWTRTNTTLSAGALSPDGVNNADRLVETAVSGLHTVAQTSITITSGQTYRFSVYVKAAQRNWIAIQISGFTSSPAQYFNVATGALGNLISGAPASVIEDAGNGWYRCSLTGVASGATATITIFLASANGTISYLGDVNNGLSIWGAQLEAGAFATSYIPTTTTSLTRNADRVSMTGTNFSSWYNASEGTIAVQGDTLTVSNSNSMTICSFLLNSSNVTRFWMWSGQPANLRYSVVASGATSADIVKAIIANTRFNVVGSYKTDLFQYALNAGATTADISGAVPAGLTAFYIGSLDSVNEPLSGHIAKINFYPQSLTSNEVQAFSK